MQGSDRSGVDRELTTRDFFILALSILLLAILAVEMFVPVDNETRLVLYWFDTAICTVLLSDFFICLYRAKDRLLYVKKNWLDFVSSIPLVPVLRVGRVVRILRLLRLLRAAYSSHRIVNYIFHKRRSSTSVATGILLTLVALVSSAAILEFENGPDSNIRTAEDAIWWSLTTMTTVGYGDSYPTTSGGRLVALFPMICGIGLFALITSLVSSWFIREEETSQTADIQQILERLDCIERHLVALTKKEG